MRMSQNSPYFLATETLLFAPHLQATMLFSVSTILAMAVASSSAAAIFKFPSNVNPHHQFNDLLYCVERLPTTAFNLLHYQALGTDVDYVISQYKGPAINFVTGGTYLSSAAVKFQDKKVRSVVVSFTLKPSAYNHGRLDLTIDNFTIDVCMFKTACFASLTVTEWARILCT